MHKFASCLIRWQLRHGRHDLPWQGAGGMTRRAQASGAGVPSLADTYRVWLSEIMLQQTQVATVIPYYQRFIASFPNLCILAAASEDEVLAHWSGLGYYARGRNLHRAAQIVVEKHRGEFPRQHEQIAELPGIGRSTAAAICALAYHERHAILDGNVRRVLARYCGIEGWTGDKKIEMQLWRQAEALLPQRDIATYIQAQMDLGATVCTRSKPKCGACPVHSGCIAYQTNRVHELPTPRPRKAVPEKYATFLLLMHGNDILLEKRPGSGIWGGLWCPPQFDDEAAARVWFVRNGMAANHGERLDTFTHTFTHFKLHITPLKIQLSRKPLCAAQPGSLWLNVEEALRAAIPAPVRKLLRE